MATTEKKKFQAKGLRVAALLIAGILRLGYGVDRVGKIFDVFADRYTIITLLPSVAGLRDGATVAPECLDLRAALHRLEGLEPAPDRVQGSAGGERCEQSDEHEERADAAHGAILRPGRGRSFQLNGWLRPR